MHRFPMPFILGPHSLVTDLSRLSLFVSDNIYVVKSILGISIFPITLYPPISLGKSTLFSLALFDLLITLFTLLFMSSQCFVTTSISFSSKLLFCIALLSLLLTIFIITKHTKK